MIDWPCVRVLSVLVLAVFLGQATAFAALIETDDCDQSCPDDEPGGKCPPICPSCSCASHSQPSVLVPENLATLIDLPPVVIPQIMDVTPLPTPDPREILHVPKPLLAR